MINCNPTLGTQRERSCVSEWASVCVHVHVSVRARAHVCVKERSGAVRSRCGAPIYRMTRCALLFASPFFILIGPSSGAASEQRVETEREPLFPLQLGI